MSAQPGSRAARQRVVNELSRILHEDNGSNEKIGEELGLTRDQVRRRRQDPSIWGFWDGLDTCITHPHLWAAVQAYIEGTGTEAHVLRVINQIATNCERDLDTCMVAQRAIADQKVTIEEARELLGKMDAADAMRAELRATLREIVEAER